MIKKTHLFETDMKGFAKKEVLATSKRERDVLLKSL